MTYEPEKHSKLVEELVCTIKSRWGIQGVRTETKVSAAIVLADSDENHWLLEPNTELEPDGERFAVEWVSNFVESMKARGGHRREWSLASEVLHWLMPWRIPVYDSSLKHSLGTSNSSQDGGDKGKCSGKAPARDPT